MRVLSEISECMRYDVCDGTEGVGPIDRGTWYQYVDTADQYSFVLCYLFLPFLILSDHPPHHHLLNMLIFFFSLFKNVHFLG